jgi:hypothetical protein
MTSVRVVKVGGSEYLQVVEYARSSGQVQTKVLSSFGKNTWENRLKAEKYAADYDRLRQVATEYANSNGGQGNRSDFMTFALAVFGLVLGIAVIVALLNDVFGSKD